MREAPRHGEADPMIPPAMSRYLADRRSNVDTHFVPDDGNLCLHRHWRDTLEQIVGSF
ncbi:MAG: hypothetical protein KC519_05570 [Anaerolineae bacterium]|nr:hypothetical protein [Anaerolineae bacterium]